jgi:regulator of protease activity HflC (stomatin/prohibitin superfamily)
MDFKEAEAEAAAVGDTEAEAQEAEAQDAEAQEAEAQEAEAQEAEAEAEEAEETEAAPAESEEAEDSDARGRITTFEEKPNQHNHVIEVFQDKVIQLSTYFGHLEREV